MHPTLTIGSFAIRTWALCATVGPLVSWCILVPRAQRMGYKPLLVFLWVLLAFPAGALGGLGLAKGLAAIGLAGSGAQMTVLGTMAACIIFSKLYIQFVFNEPPWRLLDAVAFSFPLSVLTGRIGCLLNGCCQGTLAPGWVQGTPLAALTIDSHDLAPLIAHFDQGPLWNLPLLLGLNAIVVLVVVEYLWRRQRFATGTIIATALALDSLGRFLLEFLREEKPFVLGLNLWQTLVLGLLAVAAAPAVRGLTRPRPLVPEGNAP